MKRLTVVLVSVLVTVIAILVTAGCGGSNSDSGGTPPVTKTVTPSVTIDWAARSRDVSAPASALSATVTVTGTGGSATTIEADRPAGTAAIQQTYAATQSVTVQGSPTLSVVFYAQQGGVGSTVATSTATVPIADDGTISTPVTNVKSAIASVSVTAGQRVSVGQQVYLAYAAIGTGGQVIALAPGSAFFSVASGSDKVSVTGEVATGITGGTASVTATVDNVTSPAADIAVIAPVRIALVAVGTSGQTVALVQSLQGAGIPVTRFDTVPDPATLQGFDVLALWSSPTAVPATGIFNASAAPKVKAFLDTGRGVVLLGTAPAILATGSDTAIKNGGHVDTSAIAAWFAGVAQETAPGSNPFLTLTARTGPGDFALPAPVSGGSAVYQEDQDAPDAFIAVDQVQNPSADVVFSGTTFQGVNMAGGIAYEEPSGIGGALPGRVYWQFHPYGTSG